MWFEWDLEKHGLDFIDAVAMFDAPHMVEVARTVGDEARSLAIGQLNARVVVVVYTMRGDATRIISMRRARDSERRRYEAVFDT